MSSQLNGCDDAIVYGLAFTIVTGYNRKQVKSCAVQIKLEWPVKTVKQGAMRAFCQVAIKR